MNENKTYTEITQPEFESVLSSIGKFEPLETIGEKVYLLDGNIKIFSSIIDGISRESGDDAIRVVAWDSISNLPIKSSEHRVNRIGTWSKNLTERINNLREELKTYKHCKTCGATLVERINSKTQQTFLGCLNYRNHGKSLTPPEPTTQNDDIEVFRKPITTSVPASPNKFIPSQYQLDIYDFIQNGRGHGAIIAVAGSGKTTTLIESLFKVPYGKSVVFVAFNKHSVVDISQKAPKDASVMTVHSMGFSSVRYSFGNVKVDDKKQRNIAKIVIQHNSSTSGYQPEIQDSMSNTVSKICSLIKATLGKASEDYVDEICDRYNIETDIELSLLTELTAASLLASREQKSVIDYDDMIWFPNIFNLSCKQYDFVFCDEAQDLNKSQIELILKSIKPNGRIICVGDPQQSIYGFRAADTEAIPNIITRLQSTTLPLSICYRCPSSHVELAKTIVPQIEPRPNAPEGTIQNINYEQFYDTVKPGDMVICRNNAPLISPAFALLSRGIKVTIRGRDIGEGLVNIIKKFRTNDLKIMESRLLTWRNKEIEKCKRKDVSYESVEDKYEVILILSENCDTVDCIIKKLRSIFSDENSAIVFSSIHRAKGLESSVVHIIEPSLIPSRYARRDFERIQEMNLLYVSYTRSRDKIFMISES